MVCALTGVTDIRQDLEWQDMPILFSLLVVGVLDTTNHHATPIVVLACGVRDKEIGFADYKVQQS